MNNTRIFLIKRISFLSFIFLMLVSSYAYAASTGEKITVSFSKIPLSEAMKKVEAVSNYTFFYDVNKTDLKQQVTLKANNLDIEVALGRMLATTNLQFDINNRQIILMSKQAKVSSVEKNITGRVTDVNSEPIIGANVSVKGTTNGSITDMNGHYELKNVPENAILLFSYIGMEGQEIVVRGNTTINVVMKEDAVALSDVVVIGYGVARKADLTGSVSSVSLEDVSRQPVMRVEDALRGKAPGVQISQSNSAPGGGMKIRIRGANSVNGNNDPLYVIDGFIGADYNMINPNDIESVSILKDASATSMYGSRGSNGVVLITTKMAKEGETRVEYNGFVSIDQAAKTLDVLTAKEYMTVANERQSALGANPFFSEPDIAAAGNGVNWQDEILGTAATQNHQLAISGGQSAIKYYLSASYQDQEGVVKNSFYKKYGVKANINSSVRKNFDVAFNFNGNYYESRNNSTYDGRNSPMGSALIFPPNIAIKDENGQYNISPGGYGPVASNPVFNLNNGDDNSYGMKMLGNLSLNWTIIDGLKLSVSGGVDIGSSKTTGLSLNDKMSSVSTCIAQAYDGMYVSYQNTNQLTFNKTFNSIHKLDAAVVYEQQKYIARTLGGYATGFPTIALGVNALGLGSSQSVSSGYTEWSLQSYLGRVNYALLERYLFTASMRIDGSSKFAKGNKYGYFPSGAVAWRLSDESFIKRLNLFSNLKLRASFGLIGSQAISPYATLQSLAYSGSGQNMNYYFDNNNKLYIGISPKTPANSNLKWETTAQTNVGLDFALFDGRLSGAVDYYYKKTHDLLFNVSVPDYLYGGTQLQNVGSLQNKGWEFMLSGVILDSKDWYISTNVNLSLNRNKILNMGNEKEIFVSVTPQTGWSPYTGYSVLHVDEPLGQMRGLTYLGVWKSNEKEEAAKYGKVPGDSKYLDVNGDHVIDGNDMDVIGNAMPKFTYAWNTSVTFKDFDLNIIFNGVQGNKVWNFTRYLYSGMMSDCIIPTNREVLDRWSPTNENSDYPNFSSSNVVEKQSSRWLEDGSYLRLSNLTLGYTFSKLKKNTFVKEAKVYVSGQNLFTITKYKGYNPEGSNTQSGQDIATGFDEAGYPAIRSYMVGLKFAF